ncbi:MAG TPA: SCO family protein [Acidobacteriota bacterium]|nr:SCO family protein [Acidobacteriota bacterium]
MNAQATRIALIAILAMGLLGLRAAAQSAGEQPRALQGISIEQKLDQQVPLSLNFLDSEGRSVRLSEYFQDQPVVLALVYYDCPMLCNLILNGTLRALRAMDMTAGKEFQVVTVSFDPRETPEVANRKRKSYLDKYGRPEAERGWAFLTGKQDQIQSLTQAVGFRYRWDAETQQFAHAGALIVLTPEGKVSRYLFGVEYSPRDLRLGLVEASENRIGTAVDQILLYCFQYNPLTGKYSFAVMNILRAMGILTLISIGGLILVLTRRDRRRRQGPPSEAAESHRA